MCQIPSFYLFFATPRAYGGLTAISPRRKWAGIKRGELQKRPSWWGRDIFFKDKAVKKILFGPKTSCLHVKKYPLG